MQFELAEVVRVLAQGESIAELINEAKALTWESEAEHAVVVLADKRRLLVRGGPDGISFILGEEAGRPALYLTIGPRTHQVVRLLGHTHPEVTGPSQHDLNVLTILGQTRSYLFEIGEMSSRGTLIRPRPSDPRA